MNESYLPSNEYWAIVKNLLFKFSFLSCKCKQVTILKTKLSDHYCEYWFKCDPLNVSGNLFGSTNLIGLLDLA